MSEQNKVNEDVIDVPVTEVPEQEEAQGQEVLNLEDVQYMVMVGRTKEGETFFRQAGVNDLIVIRGLLEYARDEVKHEFNKFFVGRDIESRKNQE